MKNTCLENLIIVFCHNQSSSHIPFTVNRKIIDCFILCLFLAFKTTNILEKMIL